MKDMKDLFSPVIHLSKIIKCSESVCDFFFQIVFLPFDQVQNKLWVYVFYTQKPSQGFVLHWGVRCEREKNKRCRVPSGSL